MRDLTASEIQLVTGGITVPNVSDRNPDTEPLSMADVGFAISTVSLFIGLTPAGIWGRSINFAAGAIGMAMGMFADEGS